MKWFERCKELREDLNPKTDRAWKNFEYESKENITA